MDDGKRWIIWDPRDGYTKWDGETGECLSAGVLGPLTAGNVYLTTYAQYPDERRHTDLAVGAVIDGVVFTLSGGRGVYEVVRVR